MSYSPTTLGQAAPSRGWLIAGLIVLSLIFGFGWYKSSINRRDRQAHADWKIQIEKLTRQSQLVWRERIERLRTIRQNSSDAMRQLELEYNDGEPLDLKTDDKRQIFEWTDPMYGGQLELTFDQGVFVGHGAN